MTRGRRRQRIGPKDTVERVNVSTGKKLLERIDKHAQERNVSRSLLISEVLAKVLDDRVAEKRFVETVGPGIERYLSDVDGRWIDDKIEQITTNQRNPDLQDLHMRDLLEYIRKIDDWYTSASLQKFIFDSFQRPFPKRVQSKIIRMVDMAFWFSKKREDVEGWNMWYDNMMEYIIDIIFRRKGKWNLRLRGRLFRDVFGVRMLLGLDDRPIPEELLSLLTEGVATFTQEEREEYDLAALVRSVVERGGEVAARLKRVLLGAYEADGSGDDVKEYILSLLQMEPFEGL